MNITEIVNSIDSRVTNVTFSTKNTGVDSWHVKIVPNMGKDFLLPTQYETQGQAKDAIKQLNIAYRLGMKMNARGLYYRLQKRI